MLRHAHIACLVWFLPRRVRNPISFVTSFHLSSCISVAPNRQISLKFGMGNLHQNLSRNTKFG